MEIEKTESSEMNIESPLTGTDESFSEVAPGVQTPESTEQEVMSQGGAKDEQRTDGVDPQADLGPAAGEAPEGETPEVHENESISDSGDEPIANEVEEQTSFWGGFFGKPTMPTVGE